jgi:hypothetical protein
VNQPRQRDDLDEEDEASLESMTQPLDQILRLFPLPVPPLSSPTLVECLSLDESHKGWIWVKTERR